MNRRSHMLYGRLNHKTYYLIACDATRWHASHRPYVQRWLDIYVYPVCFRCKRINRLWYISRSDVFVGASVTYSIVKNSRILAYLEKYGSWNILKLSVCSIFHKYVRVCSCLLFCFDSIMALVWICFINYATLDITPICSWHHILMAKN